MEPTASSLRKGRRPSSRFKIRCPNCQQRHGLMYWRCPMCKAFNSRHPYLIVAIVAVILVVILFTIKFVLLSRAHGAALPETDPPSTRVGGSSPMDQ